MGAYVSVAVHIHMSMDGMSLGRSDVQTFLPPQFTSVLLGSPAVESLSDVALADVQPIDSVSCACVGRPLLLVTRPVLAL